jgi:hypothetical protein
MAQQTINVGTVANDGTGDTWRAALVKTNANFDELYLSVGANPTVYVTQESDFPTQDATTITLESQTRYYITAAFSTAKHFVPQNGAVFESISTLGPTVTYTGTGSMFVWTDADFIIRNCRLDHPSAQGYSMTDSVGGTYTFLSDNVRHLSGTKFGTFNDPAIVLIQVGAAFNMNDGASFTGSNIAINSWDKFGFTSSSATFKGIDLGTSIAQTTEFRDFNASAPAGAYGISGAASNANIPSGKIAMVTACEFSGGMTDLENITVDDIRWSFRGNSPTQDTFPDALLSFNGNATETVISASNTPVIVNATWTVVSTSHFTGTTGGRATYNGVKDLPSPIDVSVGLISSGGGAIDVTVYLAKNGSVITNSAASISISGSNQAYVSVPWQESITTSDYYEIYVENNTNTTNIIVESAKLRIR